MAIKYKYPSTYGNRRVCKIYTFFYLTLTATGTFACLKLQKFILHLLIKVFSYLIPITT